MVRILIIIILLVLLGIMYYSLETEKYNHRKDNMYNNKQLHDLRNKYNNLMRASNEQFRNITLVSLPQYADNGIASGNTTLHIAPMERSASVNTLHFDTHVKIIDQIKSNNITWFYIEVPSLGTHNSKGWIKKSDFSLISSSVKSIKKNF